jgi:hypothetical protein
MTAENDLVAVGEIVRLAPQYQQKLSSRMNVFALSKFDLATEKKKQSSG